ncbi:leucine-rich repeats and immunoglobulin-like domains protein 2 [Triplophysa rosa]|uniref:leucine-rich repeats and immunoglobulin-like domains protein 2 n=1 Tax=Triplophysa rosa TaxID=992332 RepID=UPI0022118967|nr:leucine-rich repeats and immunoglobulin-like domains protein 2 [Triplophysa rosa]KAI7807735.1 putative leucine-rich repeats and immunoglobulin-like domains protein 2 [Triplophysa rosa]
MAAGWPIPQALLLLIVNVVGLDTCPSPCVCSSGPGAPQLLDCSRKRLTSGLLDAPAWITHASMNQNEFTAVPFFGDASSNITVLSLVQNRISEVLAEQLLPYSSLESLDLSSNSITELKAGSFPPMQLKYLNLSKNKISSLEPGCFGNLSSLLVLKINQNRLSVLPDKVFTLSQLQVLELRRNRIRVVESLIFKELKALKSLKMQRNGITKMMDGALFGLDNMEELELEYNNLTELNKGWLYGLHMLRVLRVNQNNIGLIRADAWEFCHRLEELDLSFNHLSRLEDWVFTGLSLMQSLNLGDNQITHLGVGVFSSLANVRALDIRNNEISLAIEDSIAMFGSLKRLNSLVLQNNKIRTITKRAFEGPMELEHLDLSKNGIISIHPDAFSHLKLKTLDLNTSSLLCDCQLQWLSKWLINRFQQSCMVVCAHPASLAGSSVIMIKPEEFVCNDFPKPQINAHPKTTVALRGTNITLNCSALSSSDSPMSTAWRKDGEVLHDAQVQNYARYQDQRLLYTTLLHLLNVNFTDEGQYQCVVSNQFGSNYSTLAKLTVNELPTFLKTPMDLTIRTGTVARLECAAEGHPTPQIAWQKDGGINFPAARERRMHVMPDDDTFFIANVKSEDMGVYSCTAKNEAGSLSANATLTVLETPSFQRPLEDRTVARGETAVLQCIARGSPAPRLNWTKDDALLVLTERHFFAAANQLLIIVDTGPADAGKYTCIMSNTLGTERGHIYLAVSPSANCDPVASVYGQDGWTTVGIVVMVVVCCVVGTSLVWVIVIYHMRRKSEDYSITNTDELNLPADIPSYLSSQGTLSEPQEGYSNSENGSHQQLMPSHANGYVHKGTEEVCYGEAGSDVDPEANGMLGNRMGSFFAGRSSFHRSEPREGLANVPNGGTGPLVICSDCYDNANIYSRTREYCPYAYLAEDEPLVTQIPRDGHVNGLQEQDRHTEHTDAPLDDLISQQNTSGFLTNHEPRLQASQQYSADVPGRSFWDGEEPHSSILTQGSVTVHDPPMALSAGDDREDRRGALEEDSYRTKPQENTSAPT